MKRLMYLIIALLILSGCSGKPSNRDIETQIKANLLEDGGEALFQIENFEKTNGFEKSKNIYIADVKYELVFKKGLDELTDDIKQTSENSVLEAMGAGLGVMALSMKYGNFKAGHRVPIEDKVTFIKTEKGWLLEQE